MCVLSNITRTETVKIYPAASLSNAITDIATQYQAKHSDVKIVPVFGASSALAKQIEAGAAQQYLFFCRPRLDELFTQKTEKYRQTPFTRSYLMIWF